MDAQPDLTQLSDDELKSLIRQLTDEERSVSMQRRVLHGRIELLKSELVARLKPDLSFLLDVPVDTGLQRARLRGGEFDRIESEQQDFFERVRAAYRTRAAAEPARWRVIDATLPAAEVARAACDALGAWVDAQR